MQFVDVCGSRSGMYERPLEESQDTQRLFSTVFDSPIDVVEWPIALERIAKWAKTRESRYVCLCNVHSLITATKDKRLCEVLRNSDMNTPDGAPVAWLLRRRGHRGQNRISGPDMMWRYCLHSNGPIFLYGSTPDTLARLTARLREAFPFLIIAGAHSPPFRDLTAIEIESEVALINGSGANVVWVGLGCPKQELWMAERKGAIKAVMIGVGAAFDYHAGTLARAPQWMQRNGLEWLYRLRQEPRRLSGRYIVTNSFFMARLMHIAWRRVAYRFRSMLIRE